MITTLQFVIGIFILGILVLIHEAGHFLVAKACGIRVLSFSIGFGNVLLKKTIGDTEYRISAIPFGGYVHMKGEHPDDQQEGSDDEFTSKPVWVRAAVALAGPTANILSSVVFLWLLFILGEERPLYLDSTIVGAVDKNSVAAEAGIKPGDSITSINSQKVSTWEDIQYTFALQDKSYEIDYARKGVEKKAVLKQKKDTEKSLKQYTFGLSSSYPPIVGAISPGTAAEKYDLRPNDRILAIDNVTIFSWFQLTDIISHHDTLLGNLQLVIERGDSVVILSARPVYNEKEKRYIFGFGIGKAPFRIIKYSPTSAIPRTLEKAWEYTTMIFDILPKIPRILVKMVTRPTTPQGISGPVGIIHISGLVAFGGLAALLNFMALIGINLGVLNLFPLIITDGGVLFF